MGVLNRLRRLIPKTRRGRLRVFVYGTPLVILALWMAWVRLDRHIPLAYDTTRITAPLAADGFPNYVEFLNARWGQGVTPEDNAAIPLFQIAGYMPDNTRRMAVAARWGLPPGPHKSLYQDYWDFVAKRLKTDGQADEASQTPVDLAYLRMVRGSWTAAELPLIKDWVAANEPALAAFHEAVKRDRYFVPLIAFDGSPARFLQETFYDGGGESRPVAEAVLTRALVRETQGDPAGARQDIADAYRYCLLLFKGGQENWASAYTARRTCETIIAVANRLPPEQARQLVVDLPPLPDIAALASEWFDVQRFRQLECLQAAARGGIQQGFIHSGASPWMFYFSVRPVEVLANLFLPVPYATLSREVNRWYDQAQANVHLSTYAAYESANAALDQEIRAASAHRRGGYRIAVEMVTPPQLYDDPVPSICTTDDFARLTLALAAYHGEHGAYPEALSELRSLLPGGVPVDRFSGAPLHYHRDGQGYLLYCVSFDLRDDYGKPGDCAVQVASPTSPAVFHWR